MFDDFQVNSRPFSLTISNWNFFSPTAHFVVRSLAQIMIGKNERRKRNKKKRNKITFRLIQMISQVCFSFSVPSNF